MDILILQYYYSIKDTMLVFYCYVIKYHTQSSLKQYLFITSQVYQSEEVMHFGFSAQDLRG